jgi:hypothetical protein
MKVRFRIVSENQKTVEDSFTLLLHRGPKSQQRLGCADLLEPPKNRYKPINAQNCP